MAAQPIETLVVSTSGNNLVASLDNLSYRIQTISDTGEAMERLRDTRFDLILLDDKVLGKEDVDSVVREIKRRIPLIPVLIITRSTDAAYQTSLMEAGADDFLTPKLAGEELQRRIRLILKQRRQAQSLALRNQNLQSINVLARKMHSATEPHNLIEDTIDRASSTFKLYGMAIVLADGELFQMFAGREGCSSNNSMYEARVKLEPYDPFRRVIQSGIVQVFQNIVTDPYFAPISALPAPDSAIILPLNFQDQKLGAMAVFGTGRNPLSHDDLLIYELFAAQFSGALNNAQHYHNQWVSAESSQHLLRGWQQFTTLRSEEEIAGNLQQLVEDIPNVTTSLVWMYSSNPRNTDTIVKAATPNIEGIFREYEALGHLSEIMQRLDDKRMQPAIVQIMSDDPLGLLFNELRGQQIMLVPIMDSARFMGGIIAGVTNSRQYNSEDSKFLAAGLAHAAGLAVERATLIQEMVQKSGRLETLVRGTSQGIFFLDDNGNVAFCNPQFTELTGINPSEVLSYEPQVLLERIAAQCDEPETILIQLQEAVERLLSPDPDVHEDYPIVEITLLNPSRDIHVEFMLIGDSEIERSSWAGIIRDNTRFKRTFGSQSLLLDMMSERIRVPYAQVRGLIQTLHEQHNRFTPRERVHFLRQLEDSVERMGHLWDNILETYNLQASGLALSREQVDLYEILQRILDSRAFTEVRRQIQIEAPANLPLVAIDELRIEQAITNVLYNAIQFSPRGANISIKLEGQGDGIQITIHDQGIGIPQDQLTKVFEPFFQASNNNTQEGAGLGLYLAKEVCLRHGGDIRIESQLGNGTSVVIALPIRLSGEAKIMQPLPIREVAFHQPVEAARPIERISAGRRVSERPMQTIMIVEGRSQLTQRLTTMMDEDYEIISYPSGEEAIRDLNSVRLDLIFLDMNLPDANGLDICERMCKRTEVPIIILADEASEPEKVRAFMIGADDYIANSVSDEELIARINVIFKRRRIPDRTREPLDLGNLYIDFARREVFLNNKPLELTRIEYDLLHTLSVHQGQVLTHKQLLEKVWGPEYQAETQYLWVNVSRLRKKLEPTPDSPRYIHTQPGVGYVFRPS
ncbi:MAG: response regulator [Anaerolineae bacterium]